MNLLRYVTTKKESWAEDPLNKIDVLAYVWLSYFDMRSIQHRFPLSFEELKDDPFAQNLKKLHETFLPGTCARLFQAMLESPRYIDTRILDYHHVIDSEKDIQFGALALQADGHTIIVFEGTDFTYVGWKEDFIMSYSDLVPSYPLAENFIQRVMAATEGPVILAGHSKGGNIAAYALSSIEDDSRIEGAYSFEGPGFHSDRVFDAHPDRLEKLHKYIPHSAIVGVMLSNETNASIVKSDSVGVLQHNTFKWHIKGNDFQYTDKRSLTSKYVDRTINGWVKALNEEERQHFTDLAFGALNRTKVKDFKALSKQLFRELPALRQAYKEMGKEDKTFFAGALKRLFRSARSAFVENAKDLGRKPKTKPVPTTPKGGK